MQLLYIIYGVGTPNVPPAVSNMLIAMAVIGAITPLLKELLTTVHANAATSTVVAIIITTVGIVLAKLTGGAGLSSTPDLLVTAAGAGAFSGGLSKFAFDGPVKNTIANIAPEHGIGPKAPPDLGVVGGSGSPRPVLKGHDGIVDGATALDTSHPGAFAPAAEDPPAAPLNTA